jgi:tetratricopeptide (TPR) repeat protein
MASNSPRQRKNKHQQIKILLQLCGVAYTQGNTTLGTQYATEAIDLARADNLENLTTLGLIDLGNAFFQRGQFAEAEQYFKQSLEYAERYKGRYSEARALMALGSLGVQRGNSEQAAKYLDEALAFFQQGGYSKETSQTLILIGRINQEKGEYDAALQAFERQLELATRVGDQSQEAVARASIGTLLGSYLDRYPEALIQFEQSRSIDDRLGYPLYVAYDLLDCGTTLWRLGRASEARASLNRAAALAANPESGSKQLLASIHLSRAQLELSQRKFGDAESRSKMALELAGDDYKEIALQARRVLGLAQALSGKAQVGIANCAEAFELAKNARDPKVLNEALLSLSEATRLNGDAQNALAYAMQAQEFYARHGIQHSEWRAWLNAAIAENMLGHRTSAVENASRAATVLSNMQQKFGAEAYTTYVLRPDVQDGSQQIQAILAADH